MGNAASLMEARHNARKDIRNERANARAGFYESAYERANAYLFRLGLNRREVCVGHMPLERVAVVFAAHSRLASSASRKDVYSAAGDGCTKVHGGVD